MGDAEEVLLVLLGWLHSDQVQSREPAAASSSPGGAVDPLLLEDTACSPPCISHVVFGLELMDMKVCCRLYVLHVAWLSPVCLCLRWECSWCVAKPRPCGYC